MSASTTDKMKERELLAKTEGGGICPECERPKATARDVIRWLSRAGGCEFACFDGVDYARLLPDEEAAPGGDLLRKRLVGARENKDKLTCMLLRQELRGRRR